MIKINNKIIAKKVKFCNNVFSKFIGLRFSKLKKDEALVIVNKKENFCLLDTFFVFYPIDVLFLDKNKKIIGYERIKPFRFMAFKNVKYIVELPVINLNFKEGDVVNF